MFSLLIPISGDIREYLLLSPQQGFQGLRPCRPAWKEISVLGAFFLLQLKLSSVGTEQVDFLLPFPCDFGGAACSVHVLGAQCVERVQTVIAAGFFLIADYMVIIMSCL